LSKTFQTEGIVFRSLKYSETSLILTIYTKEVGLHSYIVSGVRKAKSKLANIYAPLNIIDFVAYRAGEKISRIKEAQLNYIYNDLSTNIIKSSIAIFMVDIARNAIKEKEQNLRLFNFLKTQLIALDKNALDLKFTPLNFSIQLSQFLGFALDNNYSSTNIYFDLMHGKFVDNNVRHKHILNEEMSLFLNKILTADPSNNINKEQRNILLDHLINYYKLHVEGFQGLKSIPVIRQILN